MHLDTSPLQHERPAPALDSDICPLPCPPRPSPPAGISPLAHLGAPSLELKQPAPAPSISTEALFLLFPFLVFPTAGISSLVNLDTLSLSMNCLLRLPPGLEQLSALSRLDLRHNQLRQAPGALTQLKVKTRQVEGRGVVERKGDERETQLAQAGTWGAGAGQGEKEGED